MDLAKILRLKSSPCRGQVWVNRVKDLGSEPQLAREKQHLPRIAYTVYLKKIEKSMETNPSGSWDPHTGPVNKCSSSFYLITKAKFSFYKYYIKWKRFFITFYLLTGKGTCGDQRKIYRSWFSPSAQCIRGSKLRQSDLAVSTFTHWAILLATVKWKSYHLL